MNYHIAVIPGDGIGPEIVAEAKKVLNKVADTYGHTFEYEELLMGGCSIDAYGEPLTDETLERARKSDSILLGAVGGRVGVDSWYELPPEKRPEAGLLKIRKGLGLFCNLRPAILFEELSGACPLKEEIVEGGFDFIFARELTGGLYFGERYTKEIDGVRTAVDTLKYDENEIRRIAIQAFEIAMKRNKKVCSVDKANVLDSSRLWSKVVEEVSKGYPEVTLTNMLVDNCAMQIVRDPKQFDVILTENMFGDILSDEASMVTGSLGMLSSASLGEGTFGMYEPRQIRLRRFYRQLCYCVIPLDFPKKQMRLKMPSRLYSKKECVRLILWMKVRLCLVQKKWAMPLPQRLNRRTTR